MFKKFINIITFVDIPISSKFLLFSLGVLFWFVTMFIMNIATDIDVNNKTDRIVNYVVPHDRVAQKITRKLQSLNIDVMEMQGISDPKDFNRKFDMSRERIIDIKSFISALMLGGQIHDINRDTNTLIDSLTVQTTGGVLDKKRYSDELLPLVDTLDIKLAEISDIKLNMFNSDIQDSGLLDEKINEFRQMLLEAGAISNELSAEAATLYNINSEKIRHFTKVTFYSSVGVLVIATILLIIFTISISKSIANPVKSITEQIRSLGSGKVDLTKKIEIRSKDEIGILSEDFNYLMEEIHDLTTFKKVIEEDDSLEDVYSRLGKIFSDYFQMDEFVIYEVSNSQNKMKAVYPLMIGDRDLFCNEEILHNCELCKVKKTGHTISSETYPDICRQFRPDIDKIHVCIPMVIGGKIGGLVQFLFDKEKFRFQGQNTRLFKIEQYIKESLSVIEAKRLTNTLRESALKDALTGLYNRRFLQEYTETLVAGVLRREKNVGLIMCDLDFFKQVNDVYGHNVGDAVLKETSDIIKKCVRNSDLVIRFGGEEFLVLMLDINPGETEKTAEKIRETIEATKIKVSDGTIKKTISLGVSEFPADAESFWQAIKFADVALYKAKETGRNRVVRFTEEMWAEQEF